MVDTSFDRWVTTIGRERRTDGYAESDDAGKKIN